VNHDQTLNLVVHDLRSPISVIKACLDLFSRHPWFQNIPSDSKKVFGVLERNCASMMSLVDELADSRQLLLSSAKLCIAKTELRPFLEEASKRGELLANQKEIFFASYIDENLPEQLDMDFERMNQVIDNLVNNAIKFSGRNTSISFDAYLDDGSVCFLIADHGPGIPEAELGKLFREFSKTSVRPTEGESSSGLGLFIVKRIVELHHGSVSVQSKVGQGSAFKVTLPTSTNPLLH
jgi:signal transduction histidine kinase